MWKELFERIFKRKRWLAKKIIENCDETPKLRTLKANWSIELEKEMTVICSDELAKEIEKDIIDEIISSVNKE